MRTRILSVNTTIKHSSIEMDRFESAAAFSDYDILIINPRSILSRLYQKPSVLTSDGTYHTDCRYDLGHGNELISIFEKRKVEIANLIKISQGLIICYLRKKEKQLVVFTPTGYVYLDNYSWLPDCSITLEKMAVPSTFSLSSLLTFVDNEGTEVSSVDQRHPFSQWFRAFKGAIRFDCVLEISQILAPKVKIIARNKVKGIIACEIPVDGGRIVFLPPASSPSPEIEVGVLLDCIKGILDIGYESTPPVWIKKYSLPGETANAEKIEELGTSIRELASQKAKLEEEETKIKRFKGLLHETGKRGLEPLVREAFRLIGFNVLSPEEYDADYDMYIKENGVIIIGEIEATDSSCVDVSKYRQLLDYVEHEPAEDKEVKGILIGNAFRNTDPSERGEQFSPHAISRCEKQGYCRITTYQLFKIIEKVLSGITDDELKKIRADIIACEREYIFT